jgi:hypothetical protein
MNSSLGTKTPKESNIINAGWNPLSKTKKNNPKGVEYLNK